MRRPFNLPLLGCLLLLGSLVGWPPAGYADDPGAPRAHTVVSDGHPMRVWEKSAANPERVILLVHGRTWSTRPDFDLQVEGESKSLMDGLVQRDFVVYGIDLRGYGETPRDATGWMTPDRAAADVGHGAGLDPPAASRPAGAGALWLVLWGDGQPAGCPANA